MNEVLLGDFIPSHALRITRFFTVQTFVLLYYLAFALHGVIFIELCCEKYYFAEET